MTILALSGVQGFAKTLQFPEKGDAMFSITIPNDWEPEKDEDNILEATSPDEHVYISVWELKEQEDVKTLGKDIKDLLKDHAKDIKIEGEPQEAHPGGMDGLLFKGSAKDDEDDKDIQFFALLIGSKEKAAVLFIEADAETPKEEAAKLEGILKSITPPGGAKKVLRAALAVDKDTKPTDTFFADVPMIYAFFIGETLKAGDKVRGVWIADDVGTAAPKGTKIDEATATAKTPTDQSAFTLSKPTAGWPIGKYHVDFFVNDNLVETVPFTIKDK
jgi:hypothetical protein